MSARCRSVWRGLTEGKRSEWKQWHVYSPLTVKWKGFLARFDSVKPWILALCCWRCFTRSTGQNCSCCAFAISFAFNLCLNCFKSGVCGRHLFAVLKTYLYGTLLKALKTLCRLMRTLNICQWDRVCGKQMFSTQQHQAVNDIGRQRHK